MKASEWALVLSSVSMGATATTATFAVKTYLRVKPKVEILIEQHGMSPLAPKPRQQRDYRFRIRFANRGTMAIGVERVELTSVHGQWWRRELRFGGGERFEDPQKLEPFGGLKYFRNVTPSVLMHEGHPPTFVYFTAWLTDGRTIHSEWLKGLPDLVVEIGPDAEEPEPPIRQRRRWLGWLGGR
ncbi:hypothetical protein [Streptomyces sp. NPDC055013]